MLDDRSDETGRVLPASQTPSTADAVLATIAARHSVARASLPLCARCCR